MRFEVSDDHRSAGASLLQRPARREREKAAIKVGQERMNERYKNLTEPPVPYECPLSIGTWSVAIMDGN